ncbi:tRNA dimethylallyltransferase, partial [Olea europaea subsp. europaea]
AQFSSSISISRKAHNHSKSLEEAEILEAEDEWLQKLPEKKKPLYSHSFSCIEAWLRSLGFYQSREDRAAWLGEKSDWHGQLSLDITDLYK